jgi:hypothetical protein
MRVATDIDPNRRNTEPLTVSVVEGIGSLRNPVIEIRRRGRALRGPAL